MLDKKLTFTDFNNYRVDNGISKINGTSIHLAINYLENITIKNRKVTQMDIDSAISSAEYTKKSFPTFISQLRAYARYLNIIGIDAYIPDYSYAGKHIHYNPYVLEYFELSKILNYIDAVPPHYSLKNREYIFPLFFRTLYCCGLRPQEVNRLKKEDIDLNTGEIYIRKTKCYKDRHIIMSNDLLAMFIVYFNKVALYNKCYLFEIDGNPIKLSRIRKVFKRILCDLNIDKNLRLYDFRHSFITNTITEWLENDEDIYMLLPYLSEYVGHNDFQTTYYYLHLVPQNIVNNKSINWDAFHDIYPKTGNEYEV